MRPGSEQPFLFFPEGPDVRWRSFATVADQAEGGRRALETVGLGVEVPAPSDAPVVAYAWAGGLAGADGLAADFAIRCGGWTAAPVPVSADRSGSADGPSPGPVHPPEHRARLALPWETQAPTGVPVACLPEAGREVGRSAVLDRSRSPIPALPGGVLVRGDGDGASGGATAWRQVGADTLVGAARSLGLSLGMPVVEGDPRPSGERPVAVAWLDPSLPDGRVFLEWAVGARAALYLEPDRRVLGGSTAWVRPTVVAGDAYALAVVVAEIRRRDRPRSRIFRRQRAPFGRLRRAVLLGGDALTRDDRVLLEERGVTLVRPELNPR